jgi:hypothetical protein
MKRFLAAAALLLLAAPAQAAPAFSLVMVEDCQKAEKPRLYQGAGGLPFCLKGAAFLTAKDIVAARETMVSAERLSVFGIADPHVLHLTVTAAAAKRLTDLSYDNRGESFVAMVDDQVVSITSIGDPLHGAELELLVSLANPEFAVLVKSLGKAP